jgi:ParB family chromosome partitioning protein
LEIKIDLIDYDEEWNCRERIIPATVSELVRSIQKHGLIEPVIVRPLGDRYSLVAGFRRFFSCARILKWETIPAVVRELTEMEAKELNIAENFVRADLNLLEEAQALQYFSNKGIPDHKIKDHVGKSYGWCQPRIQLMKLPEGIQNAAAAGFIKSSEVRKLYVLRNEPEKLAKRAKEIIDGNATGRKKRSSIAKKIDKTIKKLRSEEGMNLAIDKIMDLIEVEEDSERSRILQFGARSIAFCAGNISEDDWEADIRKVMMV